jgi:hypothetical protein
MVTEESLTATKKDMKGSTLFMYAENSSEIRKLIEADVYYTSNVVSPLCCSCKGDDTSLTFDGSGIPSKSLYHRLSKRL